MNQNPESQGDGNDKTPFRLTKPKYFMMLLALLWGLNVGWIAIATYFPALDFSRFLLKNNSQSQFDEGKLVLFLVMKVLVEGILCFTLFKAFQKVAVVPLYVELSWTLGIVLFIVVQVFVGNMRPMADSRYSLVYASDTPMDRLAYLMLLTPFLYSTVGFFNIFFLDSFMAMATRTTFAPPNMDDDRDSEAGDTGDSGDTGGQKEKGGFGKFFGGIANGLAEDLNPLSGMKDAFSSENGNTTLPDIYSKNADGDPTEGASKAPKYIPPPICPDIKECIKTAKIHHYIIQLMDYPQEKDSAYQHATVYMIEPTSDRPTYYFLIDMDKNKLTKAQIKKDKKLSILDESLTVTFSNLLISLCRKTPLNDVFKDPKKDVDSIPEVSHVYANVIVSFIKDFKVQINSMDQTYPKEQQYRIVYSIQKMMAMEIGEGDTEMMAVYHVGLEPEETAHAKVEAAEAKALKQSKLPPKENFKDVASQIREEKLNQEENKKISISDDILKKTETKTWNKATDDPKSADEQGNIDPEKFEAVYRDLLAQEIEKLIKFRKEQIETEEKAETISKQKEQQRLKEEAEKAKRRAEMEEKERLLKQKEKEKDQKAVNAMYTAATKSTSSSVGEESVPILPISKDPVDGPGRWLR